MTLTDKAWEALKQDCCKDPDNAKMVVFLTEKKFKDALRPILDSTQQDRIEAFQKFLDQCSEKVSTWELWERTLLNG
jgi:hypothetical protein